MMKPNFTQFTTANSLVISGTWAKHYHALSGFGGDLKSATMIPK